VIDLDSATKAFEMLKVKVELQGQGDRWQVKETSINYDDQGIQRLGPIDQMMDYEGAIKEAKRWTMLIIRQKRRRETEDDIVWEVEPSLPPRHIPKL
jgi:hypothetical protein